MFEPLYRQWKKTGIAFNVPEAQQPVDLEKVLLETAAAGRQEARLLWGMLTWVIQAGDLINISRLSRLTASGNNAVLGAVLALALERGADRKLKTVMQLCRPLDPPEILFAKMSEMECTRNQERENGLPEFKAWGLYSSTVRIMDDAIAPRPRILRSNRNLACRAVFGAGIKAEIIFWLSNQAKTSILELSRRIGFSYQPVHAEVSALIKNRMLDCEFYGRVKAVSLSVEGRKFLKAMPV
jgi:hypothetical protein